MTCDEDPLRRRPGSSTAQGTRWERCVRMTTKTANWVPELDQTVKLRLSHHRSGEIGEHGFGPGEGALGVNDPGDIAQRREIGGEGFRVIEMAPVIVARNGRLLLSLGAAGS
jgi:hypothetical protein